MSIIITVITWILGLVCLVFMVLSLLAGHYVSSGLAMIMAIVLIPVLRNWFWEYSGIKLPVWLQIVIVPVCLFFFMFFIFNTMGNKYSIYENDQIEEKLNNIYNSHLALWGLDFQTRFIKTQYGIVHVIASGKEDLPPLILLHASSMSSWPWVYNVEELNQHYRTYAIDTIGDAGRSKLSKMEVYPNTGEKLAVLYKEIMDSLGVEKASFIGASQGGYIATNIALYAQERVDKIVLCGPMGYTGTFRSVMRIIFTTMFPLKAIQENATRWAFGDNPHVLAEVSEWFRTILTGVISRQARPKSFSDEQLQSLKMPVLLLLGNNDGLTGNPQKALKRVEKLPNFQTRVLETGHLISAEKPEMFNHLVLKFLGE
ncbi:MAG: alpha/beta hydrolase [Candidatus Cloacimonetes bacterium]|nr:alpha/beta hydrolase [Candidatus Cloacimonadota bacterium]